MIVYLVFDARNCSFCPPVNRIRIVLYCWVRYMHFHVCVVPLFCPVGQMLLPKLCVCLDFQS